MHKSMGTGSTASDMDMEAEVEHAIQLAGRVLSVLISRYASLFPHKSEAWFIPDEGMSQSECHRYQLVEILMPLATIGPHCSDADRKPKLNFRHSHPLLQNQSSAKSDGPG